MKAQELLKKIGLNFKIDSFFNLNNNLLSASFDYSQLNNTCFEFNFSGKRVLHFTSLESARLILDSGYLRGSNLNQFEDKDEVTYALELVNLSLSKNWKKIKDRTFAICLTEKINNNIKENYNYHWEKYANSKKGVVLEFEFITQSLPSGFFPLKIQYFDKENESIKELINHSSDLKELTEADMEFILPILSGIKRKNYCNESEVRLMFNISEEEIAHLNNKGKFTNTYFSFEKDNSIKLELRFPFLTPVDSKDSEKSINRILELKKIYLGKDTILHHDNTSSSIIINHFQYYCNEKGVELEFT